jgi:HPt (histidine-containing phosphotransfer) domain-containing protein
VDELFATLANWVRPASAQPVNPTLPTMPGLDASAGLAAVDGNEALYLRLLGMFREREADFETRLRAAHARGDASAALRGAHDLKSVAGTLGMPGLQQAAAALESACGQGASAEAIEPLLKEVVQQLEPLLSTLQASAIR